MSELANHHRRSAPEPSPGTQLARERMLAGLLREFNHVHARRASRRRIAAWACLTGLLIVIGCIGWMGSLGGGMPAAQLQSPRVALNLPTIPAVVIETVGTHLGIAERLAVTDAARVEIVDDQQLLAMLADAGVTAGLVRIDGRLQLIGTDLTNVR